MAAVTFSDYARIFPERITDRLRFTDGPMTDQCLVWQGHTSTGYASARWEGNVLRGEGLAAIGARRTECPAGHPYDDANTKIYRGRRYCRQCHADHSRAYRARQKARS